MLYFVIPLRSAKTTSNWLAIQRLLERTLQSVDNQVCRSFKCLIVCHERPDAIEIPPSCEIVEVPFEPPAVSLDTLDAHEALFAMHSDKGRKLIFGLSKIRKHPGAFVMFLDADDLVSNRLSGLVAKNPHCNGWYFNLGYRWNHQTPNLLFPRKNFFHECGSAYILRAELAPFPEVIDLSKDLDDYFIRRYVVHAYVRDCMQDLGFPLEPLPFPGSIYTFNNQNLFADRFRKPDSILRQLARMMVKGRRITDAQRSEFCIPKVSKP